MRTKLHQTKPVKPNAVAKYVPKIIVQTNGSITIKTITIITSKTPITVDQSALIKKIPPILPRNIHLQYLLLTHKPHEGPVGRRIHSQLM